MCVYTVNYSTCIHIGKFSFKNIQWKYTERLWLSDLSGKCLFPTRTAQITWYSYFTGCWWQSARKGSEIIGMRACANTVRHKAYKNDLTWSKSWSRSRDTRSEHICKVTSWFIFTVHCIFILYNIHTSEQSPPYQWSLCLGFTENTSF